MLITYEQCKQYTDFKQNMKTFKWRQSESTLLSFEWRLDLLLIKKGEIEIMYKLL